MNVMTPLSVPAGPARFTSAEFLRMVATGAFDDIKIELIEGELQRMPPPGNRHSLLQVTVVAALLRVLTSSLIRTEIGLDLGSDTFVAADVAVLKAPVSGDGMIPAADILLAVEIAVSTADRDLLLKRRLYAGAGIPHYWVIDAEREVVHVFDRVERDDYLGLTLVRFGEPLAVPGTAETIVLA